MDDALSLYRSHKNANKQYSEINSAFDIVSDEALEQLRKRGENIITTATWDELEQEAHDDAFTVANIMSADVVQEVYSYVERAVSEGLSFDKFRFLVESGELTDRMKKAGWTGDSRSRLKIIYDTNISLAQAKGKYQRLMLNADKKPYGIYHQLDRKTKNKDHEKWNGKKFRLDDPIWDTIFPPSDFGCACWVQATDDPTGVESGADYIDSINTEEYRLSPIKPWKPDTSKYVDGIQNELNKVLKVKENSKSPYSTKDVDNFMSASSVAISKKAYLEQELNKTANKLGLSEPEALAIYHYSRTGFADLNYNLRNDTSDDFTISFEKILNTALDKMPTHKGTAFRGVDLPKSVSDKYLSAFRNGEVIAHEYFTSSSTDESVAEECGTVQFIIKSKNGKYINDLSAHGKIKATTNSDPDAKQEEEVLFKSKSKFKVTNHDTVNNSLVIELEEM